MTLPVLDSTPAAFTPLLRVSVVVAMAAAAIGTVTQGRLSTVAGGVAVGVIIAAPLLRVSVLGVHWLRRRDVRFALAAFGLVVVAGGGALLALL